MQTNAEIKQVQRVKKVILIVLAVLVVLPSALAVHFFFAGQKQKALVADLRLEQTQADPVEPVSAPPVPTASSPMPEPEPPPPARALEAEPIGYQLAYPALYVEDPPDFAPVEEKTVYLTFDDGPSEMTGQILDTLDKYDAKATFFVVGGQLGRYAEELKEIVKRGHAVGVHSDTHDYYEIYDTPETYLTDFERAYNKIYDLTGIHTPIFRFVGGSVNAYNRETYREIIAEMTRRGFVYYDWNVSAQDAAKSTQSVQQIQERILAPARAQKHPVVLLHDGARHAATTAALDGILETLSAEGYQFKALDHTVRSVSFAYPDG